MPPSIKELRDRAEQALRGLLGRGLSRADRRLVARAYANAAWRLSHGLPEPTHHAYATFKGKPVVLNPQMVQWVAGVKPLTAEEIAYASPSCV